MNSSKIFFSLFYHNSTLFLLYFCIIISFEFLIEPVNKAYPKLKILPNGNYFVLLEDGIYIYNNDFSNKTLIKKLNNDEYITDETESNKTVLSEIHNNTNDYILFLLRKNIYLFVNKKEVIIKYDFSGKDLTGEYYNLIPYKLDNNFIYYIIIFSNKIKKTILGVPYNVDCLTFFHYKINLISNENMMIKKNSSELEDKIYMPSCHILSSENIICLYLIGNSKDITISEFKLANLEKQTEKENKYSNEKINEIFNITSSISIDENNIFFCYYWKLK